MNRPDFSRHLRAMENGYCGGVLARHPTEGRSPMHLCSVVVPAECPRAAGRQGLRRLAEGMDLARIEVKAAISEGIGA